MLKVVATVFTGVMFSFYFFPFEFSFFPGVNTKMGLAVVGILFAIIHLVRNRELKLPSNLLRVELCAALVSLVGFVAVTANNTPDYAYATYFVSMTVWLSGAFAVCCMIKVVHQNVTVENLTCYLTCVCVAQCVLALIIDSNVVVKTMIDTYIMQDQVFLTEIGRLYGVGASLDTAGVRFSACLILLMFVINKNKGRMSDWGIFLATLAYMCVAVIGNMVARTTIVGVGMSLLYAFLTFRPHRMNRSVFRVLRIGMLVLVILIPLSIYLYDNSPQFYQLSRFAFEGFFSLAETGEWEIDSNERLKTMIVFPDNVKTWIIGDGYFSNPYDTDYTYVGYQPGGYYMGTDIGYLRFVFYFGLLGLFAFSYFFVFVAKECISILPDYKLLILFILLLGFVIWLKVATDVFLVFALLICIGNMQDDKPETKFLL